MDSYGNSGMPFSASEKLDLKNIVRFTALGGSIINLTFSVSMVVGDILKGDLGVDGILSLAISALLLYLVVHYPLAEVIVGWLTLIVTVLNGLFYLRRRK